MYALVVAVHIIACLVLIAVILMQAGRGGGLSEAFGGGSTQTIFGTRASTFLTRATEVAAVVFLITCIALGVMTAKRGRSLVDLRTQRGMPPVRTMPAMPLEPAQAGTEAAPVEGTAAKEEPQKVSIPEGETVEKLDTRKVPEVPEAEPATE